MKKRSIKRIWALLLALCMVAGLLPATTAWAAEVVTGTCGDSMTWSLDLSTGVMTISGSGEMSNFTSGYSGGGAPWKDHMESITSVVVEEGVVTIGSYAFYFANNLTRVSLPYGLLKICPYAFLGCKNLTDLELPDSLMRLQYASLINIGATELKLPHSLIWLDDNALQDCTMEELTIPYSVTKFDHRAIFSTNIQNFNVEPDHPMYTSVDGVLFSKDMKTLIVYPAANPRTSYAIPEGVTTVERNLSGPDHLIFPTSFVAFEDFGGPGSLDASNYTVAAGNPAFSSRDGVLFDKDGTTLIRYPIRRTDTSYRVPDGVTTIGPYGFTEAASLTSITIPASVTNLSLEYGSFNQCESLTDIYFEGSPFQWSLLDPSGYGFTNHIHMDPERIVNIHFGAEDETYTVTYAPGEGVIRDSNMSPSVVAKGDTAVLSACGGYFTPAEGKRFKCWEIDGEEYLPGMTYTPTADVTATALWEDSSLPSGRCGENVTWSFDAETGTLTISGSGEMLYPTGGCVPWLEMRPSITRVVVEDGVTALADVAFAECTQLTDVSLANSITQFKRDAFMDCEALKTIELPQGLTDLGRGTFWGCGALERIVLPDTVTSIDDSVFLGCRNLREIYIPDSVTSIGEGGFKYCTSLQSIDISNVTTLGRYVFEECTALQSITVGEGLKSIGDGTFAYCTALENITLPGSVHQYCKFVACDNLNTVTLEEGISVVQFSGCDNLNTLYLPESLKNLTIFTAPAPSEIYYAGSRIQWKQIARTLTDNSGNSAPWPEVTMHYGNADVTYDRNGGTDGMPVMFIKKNTSLTLPACRFIAPEGKVFKAWEIDGQEYQPGDPYLIEDDIVLKALWEDGGRTVTFVADGVEVGTVTLTEGDTSLEEPAVPAKAHYDGAWENYDLAAATGDITVNAVYTLNNDHSGSETSVVTPPTHTEGGYTTYTCSVCGNVRRGDETDPITTPVNGTVARGTYMDADGNMQSYEVHFDKPLTQTSGTLAPGNYYLADDVRLTDGLKIRDGVVRVDLAGHMLRGTGKSSVFSIDGAEEKTLEIYDSDANKDNSSHTKHYYTIDENNHRWVFNDNSSSETFVQGGVITNPDFIAVNVSSGMNFTLYQGTLSGSKIGISVVTEVAVMLDRFISLLK